MDQMVLQTPAKVVAVQQDLVHFRMAVLEAPVL
jgi:hypothetical protein